MEGNQSSDALPLNNKKILSTINLIKDNNKTPKPVNPLLRDISYKLPRFSSSFSPKDDNKNMRSHQQTAAKTSFKTRLIRSKKTSLINRTATNIETKTSEKKEDVKQKSEPILLRKRTSIELSNESNKRIKLNTSQSQTTAPISRINVTNTTNATNKQIKSLKSSVNTVEKCSFQQKTQQSPLKLQTKSTTLLSKITFTLPKRIPTEQSFMNTKLKPIDDVKLKSITENNSGQKPSTNNISNTLTEFDSKKWLQNISASPLVEFANRSLLNTSSTGANAVMN